MKLHLHSSLKDPTVIRITKNIKSEFWVQLKSEMNKLHVFLIAMNSKF